MSEERYNPTDNDIDEYIAFLRQQTVDAMDKARSLDLSPLHAAVLSIQASMYLSGAVLEVMRDNAPDDVIEEAVERLVESITEDMTNFLPVKAQARSLPAGTDMAAVMGVVSGMTAEPSGDKH